MTKARRGAVLHYLADHRREFCATDGAAPLWLTFDEPGACEQRALRTWQIWHDGHEHADGHRTEPGTLRLQTKLPAADVEIGRRDAARGEDPVDRATGGSRRGGGSEWGAHADPLR